MGGRRGGGRRRLPKCPSRMAESEELSLGVEDEATRLVLRPTGALLLLAVVVVLASRGAVAPVGAGHRPGRIERVVGLLSTATAGAARTTRAAGRTRRRARGLEIDLAEDLGALALAPRGHVDHADRAHAGARLGLFAGRLLARLERGRRELLFWFLVATGRLAAERDDRGLVSRHGQQQEEGGILDLRKLLARYVAVQQVTGKVVLGVVAVELRHLHGFREHPHRSHPALIVALAQLGVVEANHEVREVEDLLPVFLGNPHHVADDLKREVRGHLGHELAFTFLDDAIDDLASQVADVRFEACDVARRKTSLHQAPKRHVPGRVHHEHDGKPAAALFGLLHHGRGPLVELTGRQSLAHRLFQARVRHVGSPALGGEELRVARHVAQVFPLGDAPEGGTAGALVPVDRILVSDLRQPAVRAAFEKMVRVGEVDMGKRHGVSLTALESQKSSSKKARPRPQFVPPAWAV